MNKNKYKGIFPALLTPFDKNGNVNYESTYRLIDYCLGAGVKGFYVLGSSGEVFRLSREERIEFYTKVAEYVKGKCTLIAHIGDMSTKQVIEYGKLCEKLGYDAISAVTPFYFGVTSESVEKFYLDIVSNVNLPLIMYYIPVRAGNTMNLPLMKKLLKNDKILGMKFSSSDLYTLERVRNAFPDKVILFGCDEMLTGGLATGVDGAIGTTYNLYGELSVEIYNLCEKGDFKKAYEIQHKANDLTEALLATGDCISTIKYALTHIVGIDCGDTRDPGVKTTDEWGQTFIKDFGDRIRKA